MTARDLSYVLPLRTGEHDDVAELAGYVRGLVEHVGEVVVVDGSAPVARSEHAARFGRDVVLIPPAVVTPMGKVGGVLTGVQRARYEHVVVADDDVRYTPAQLERIDALLDGAEVVRPQNHFDPLPWHARVDTARTLLNRVAGGDWPGTLGVRRSALLRAGGYAGDVMFENFELVRTIRAAGGRERLALDLLVRRTPPDTRHFWHQQVRQAYDEWARPVRLVGSLLVLPAVAVLMARRRGALLLGLAGAVAALAELGRRRAGGRTVYPASSSLVAPLWLVWRSACSWAAVAARAQGGVRYRQIRLRRAATPRRERRRRIAAVRQAEAPVVDPGALVGGRRR